MSKAQLAVAVGRLFGVLALLALLGAWMTQITGRPFLGMTQEHLFSDATVLALFCIAGLLDGIIHAKLSATS